MTLTGGFLFGSVLGTIFVKVGATTGATLAFLAARYVLRDWVERKFGKRMEPIQAGFAQNAFSLPVDPAAYSCLSVLPGPTWCPAWTRIPLGTYVIGTSVGIIPAASSTRSRGDNSDPSTRGGNRLTTRVAGVYLPGFAGSRSPFFIVNSGEGEKRAKKWRGRRERHWIPAFAGMRIRSIIDYFYTKDTPCRLKIIEMNP